MFRHYMCILAVFMVSRLSAQIVLSEIMFNPEGNERYDEFIELYNRGEEAVDLFGWLLSDGTKFNTILPFENTSVLLPQHFALILVPNYFQHSHSYDENIPDEALIFTIDKSQFGAYGLKNTEGETVSIYQPDSTLVAQYCYSPDNADGYSEEKIDVSGDDSDANWRNSIRKGGTPGYENSVTPKPIDLAIARFDVTPAHPSTQDSLQFALLIKNRGRNAVESCYITVQDSLQGNVSTLMQQHVFFGRLAASDSSEVVFHCSPLPAGDHKFIAHVNISQDGYVDNNIARAVCRVVATYPPRCIVINEIMYDTDEGADEWIELYNNSPLPVNLAHWLVRDKKKSVVITDENLYIDPGSYCLLTNVECESCACLQVVANIPELNNSGDAVVICDAAGAVIDSVMYDRRFGGERNISIERIRFDSESTSSSNWSSSVDANGSTPCALNSASPRDYDAALYGHIHLTPEQPRAGDDVILAVKVTNAGWRDIGEVMLTLAYRPMHKSTFITVDKKTIESIRQGRDATVHFDWPRIEPGIHVVNVTIDMPGDLVQDNNELCDTIAVGYPPNSVVINEIMYSPASDQCEWIELYNDSEASVELMHWALSDSDRQKRVSLSETSFLLFPQEFLVIGSDSTLYELGAELCLLRLLPTLNNTFDHVVLYDAGSHTIDEVHYTSDMGGATGRSLERIHPGVAAFEKTNWATCVDVHGHTAGAANSVYVPVLPTVTSLTVSPNPFSPDGDGRDDFAAMSYALPGTLAHVNLKIFDIRGRLVRFLLNNEPSGAERTVYWDGLDDSGIKCRMGIYIILFEAFNESKMCIEKTRTTVVLAGVL